MQPAPARAASDTSAQSHFTSRAQGRPRTMPLEVLLPACTPASTSSWAQGRHLSDLSVQGGARGVQQSTLRNEEVNKQPTFFQLVLPLLARSTPPDRCLVVRCGVRFVGCMFATRFILLVLARGRAWRARPTTFVCRARAGSGAAPTWHTCTSWFLNLVHRRVRRSGGAVDLERLCLNAVRPRSSVTAVVALLTPGQLPTVQPRRRQHDGVRARSC